MTQLACPAWEPPKPARLSAAEHRVQRRALLDQLAVLTRETRAVAARLALLEGVPLPAALEIRGPGGYQPVAGGASQLVPSPTHTRDAFYAKQNLINR